MDGDLSLENDLAMVSDVQSVIDDDTIGTVAFELNINHGKILFELEASNLHSGCVYL